MARKKEEKKLINLEIPYLTIELDMFEGELDEIVENIKNLPNILRENIEKYHYPTKNLDEVEIFKIKIDRNWDDDIDILLLGYRWETDKEFEERLEKNKEAEKKRKLTLAANKRATEKAERELYEKLKKQFGDD